MIHNINRRISHSGCLRPNIKGMPETMVCRIRMFMWSFGALKVLVAKAGAVVGIVHLRPWAGSKSRSTLGFYNLHHRSIGVQNWGLYCLDPPRGLGLYKSWDMIVLQRANLQKTET